MDTYSENIYKAAYMVELHRKKQFEDTMNHFVKTENEFLEENKEWLKELINGI